MEIYKPSQRCGSSSSRSLPSYRTVYRISSYMPTHLCHTVFFILILLLHEGLPAQVPTFVPTDIKRFDNGSSTTDGYYRYLQVDVNNNLLYVGAMEYLYRLDLSDITNVKNSIYLPPDTAAVTECIQWQKSEEFQCKNHIRSIAVIGNEISVCGTGAYSPREDILRTSDLSFVDRGRSGVGRCPFEPGDNSTSIYIANGNPEGVGAFYTGTVRDKDHKDPVILRPALRDSASVLLRTEWEKNMLDNPDFVNSFDVDDHVYFFFRESAQEAMNCGKAVYSRIARVCKNDRGGFHDLEYKWTTYLKARLNCSISGEFPFYFHEMYDVKRIGDTFYGTFSTNNDDGLYGSAVCGFSKRDIEAVFDGDFKEQLESTSLWLTVPPSRVPDQRPGACVENSKDLPRDVETFMKTRSLMDTAVGHTNTGAGVPLYYQSGLLFNNMAVDQFNIEGTAYRIFYLSTDQGQIHKVVQWQEGGHARSRLVSVLKPFGDTITSIKSIKLYSQVLYIGTDSAVIQLSVIQCQSYIYCSDCVHDPNCGWHSTDRRCTTYDRTNAKNSVKDDNPILQCDSQACKKQGEYENSVRIPGDPIYLHCDTHCPSDSVLWYHDGSPVTIDNVKYFLTQDGGIIVFNITVSDGGDYLCKDSSSSMELTKHVINIPGCGDDTSCLWREEFRNWCSEFDSYKKQFNNWVCLKDACLESDTCMPSGISDACPVIP